VKSGKEAAGESSVECTATPPSAITTTRRHLRHLRHAPNTAPRAVLAVSGAARESFVSRRAGSVRLSPAPSPCDARPSSSQRAAHRAKRVAHVMRCSGAASAAAGHRPRVARLAAWPPCPRTNYRYACFTMFLPPAPLSTPTGRNPRVLYCRFIKAIFCTSSRLGLAQAFPLCGEVLYRYT
jgi:hypothetical protein